MANRTIVIASLLISATGAVFNVLTTTRATRSYERTADTYLIAVMAFAGLAAMAYAFRANRRASIGVLLGALVASGLAVVWWTNPFGEWTGLSMLLLIPIQCSCCLFGFVGRWLGRK